MKSAQKVFTNLYRDSVTLMQLSAKLSNLPGIEQASAIMATEANITLLEEAGLLRGKPAAGVNDLLLVALGEDDQSVADALARAEESLNEAPAEGGGSAERIDQPRSLDAAMSAAPGANLALISCPGEFAAAEAMKALHLGLNVMIFSDNVSLDDEIRLKETGDELDLFVMGPDCGTAIINGVPLGFANVVAKGVIGIVAASGTGLQQVTCLIDKGGAGISQAIGTGGRDLKSEVGGRTMIRGIDVLARDPTTKIIVLVSKPPDRDVAEAVLAAAEKCGKPVIVTFLGDADDRNGGGNIRRAGTLEETACLAVAAAKDSEADLENLARHALDAPRMVELAAALRPDQTSVRALYSGGTFAYETMLILEPRLGAIRSSSPLSAEGKLADPWISEGHTVIDLGDDIFTRGRPHPMIDHRLRNERIVQEARAPETAVIIVDVVLGYGAHEDPAGEMTAAITKARDSAREAGRTVHFVGFVCGTQGDPQGLSRQEHILTDAGVLLTENNAQAARLAMDIILAANTGDETRSGRSEGAAE